MNKKELKKRAKKIKNIKKKRLENKVFMKLGAKLRAYLFTGILVTAPVAITFYLAYKLILWVDVFVTKILPPQYNFVNYMPMTIPGFGLVILIGFLMLVGMFAAGFLGRFFIRLGEWFVAKMPLISSIYSLLKQIFETVFSSKTQAFKKVVMLEYPRKGIWILGLVSADLQGEIEDKLPDEMQVYKETPLDMEHPAYGVDRKKLRTPWERDYFTIENGNIKLISGRPDKTEFDGVKVEYPKGTKEICLFVEKNRDSLIPMNEELFIKDYKLCQHRNNLMGELMGMDMTIEDFRERMDNPPSPQDKKTMNRLWNERQKIVKQICKLDKKENMLLSGKIKKKNERER